MARYYKRDRRGRFAAHGVSGGNPTSVYGNRGRGMVTRVHKSGKRPGKSARYDRELAMSAALRSRRRPPGARLPGGNRIVSTQSASLRGRGPNRGLNMRITTTGTRGQNRSAAKVYRRTGRAPAGSFIGMKQPRSRG